MKKAELILIAITVVGYILFLTDTTGGAIVTTAFSLILSLLYFPLGIFLFNDVKLSRIGKKESYNGLGAFRQIAIILVGSGLQSCVIGLLFKVMCWPGAEIMNTAGITVIIFVTIVAALAFINGPRTYFSKIIKRVVIYGGLCVMVAFLPKYIFIDI